MKPSQWPVRPGDRMWLRITPRRKLQLVDIESVTEDGVTVRGPNGGRLDYPWKKFWAVHGRVEGKPLYENTVIPLGGGWADRPGGWTFREALQNAYLQSVGSRSVTINRRMRYGLSQCVAEVAEYDGRVWLGKHGTLSSVKWKGEPPDPSLRAVEITGRFERAAPDYAI